MKRGEEELLWARSVSLGTFMCVGTDNRGRSGVIWRLCRAVSGWLKCAVCVYSWYHVVRRRQGEEDVKGV